MNSIVSYRFSAKNEALLWGGFGVLLLLNYWPTFNWMISRFEEANSYSTHGYLIPFISGYLLWNQRQSLSKVPIQASAWGLIPLSIGLLLHWISGIADVSSISGFTIIFVLAGFILLLRGWQQLKELWFPIAFLFFAIPLPDFIISGLNFKLKFWASDLASQLLNVTGLPAIREGSFMMFGQERLAIGDVCSGLRSLISLVALGVLYAYLIRERSKWNVIATLLAIAPAAVIGNGLRIFLVSYLVYWLGSSKVFKPIIFGQDLHLMTGFFIFATAFGCLYAVNSLVDAVRGNNRGADSTK